MRHAPSHAQQRKGVHWYTRGPHPQAYTPSFQASTMGLRGRVWNGRVVSCMFDSDAIKGHTTYLTLSLMKFLSKDSLDSHRRSDERGRCDLWCV